LRAVISPRLEKLAADGCPSCCLAYGQTGSGKTHTMVGGAGDTAGIIPRMIARLLEQVARRAADSGGAERTELRLTMLQIGVLCDSQGVKNAKAKSVTDLLHPSIVRLEVREPAGDGNFCVPGLTERVLTSGATLPARHAVHIYMPTAL
jgi:Kinesin motor domain